MQHLFDLAISVPGLFLIQLICGLTLYFGFSALSHLYFCVRRRAHYFPGEGAFDRAKIKKAQRLACWGTLGNALLMTPIQWAVAHGYSRLYYRVSERGWAYYVLTAILFLVITETLVYWIHRCLHLPLLYKHLHKYHHEHRQVTPWVSMAFHPLDSFAQAVPHCLCIFLFPVHVSIYALFLFGIMLWSFSIHDRVSWVRHPLVNYAAHHTIHHLYNKYNFGQFLTLWDRLCGSYRDPRKETRFCVLYPRPPAVETAALLRQSPAHDVSEGRLAVRNPSAHAPPRRADCTATSRRERSHPREGARESVRTPLG